MKNGLQCMLVLAVLAGLVGCSGPGGSPGSHRPPGQSVQSDKSRVTAPDVPTGDLARLVDGNTAFALELYRFLGKENQDDNLFYSPYSISLALAMTYAGAREETEQQIADTLHFTLPQERLHPAFNHLDLTLTSRGEGAEGADGEGFRLHIVNRIWGQEGYEFLDAFLDVLATNYGAGLRLVDFAGAPEESRVTINDWVEEQTEGRIEDLIPQGIINELTRLVLTNAIYFNAAWAEPFEERLTEDGTFYPLDGGDVSVPMMRHTASFGYAEDQTCQAVELPYDGRKLAMLILLPQVGEFEAFEDSLDAEQMHAILDNLKYGEVALTMPKFEVESDFSLVDALTAMGMPDAFSMNADFSGMDGTRELFIKDAVHKAFVSVDEAGTEAAAATAVVMQLKGSLAQPIEVAVDHPFLFFIRDVETGAILFVGRVVNPGA
jgi:serpin B